VEVLAILGTGVQARAHIEAIRWARDFEELRVWGPHTRNGGGLRLEVWLRRNVS